MIAWVAFVCLLPQNLYGLSVLLLLVPLWGLALMVGGWHLLHGQQRREQALKVVAAFPLAFVSILLLDNVVGLPVTDSDHARGLFVAVLSAYPLLWLGRWLFRVTQPSSNARVSIRFGDLLLLGLVGTLALQMLFLLSVLANDESVGWMDDLFGADWYEHSLSATVVATVLMAIVGVPFALLGLIRGTRHRGVMLVILLCFAFLFLCGFGFFVWLAALAVG